MCGYIDIYMRTEVWLSHHGFKVDLCKDKSWDPGKLEVRYSLDFWAVIRVSVRSDSEAIELKALKDWLLLQVRLEGKVIMFVGKGMKPICVAIWFCSSNKLCWLTIWEVVDMMITFSYDISSALSLSLSSIQ